MKKQNGRQSRGNKLESPASTDTSATTSRPVHRETGEGSTLSDRTLELIRARAYHRFESRGHQPGQELDDWLEAEREILRPFRSL